MHLLIDIWHLNQMMYFLPVLLLVAGGPYVINHLRAMMDYDSPRVTHFSSSGTETVTAMALVLIGLGTCVMSPWFVNSSASDATQRVLLAPALRSDAYLVALEAKLDDQNVSRSSPLTMYEGFRIQADGVRRLAETMMVSKSQTPNKGGPLSLAQRRLLLADVRTRIMGPASAEPVKDIADNRRLKEKIDHVMSELLGDSAKGASEQVAPRSSPANVFELGLIGGGIMALAILLFIGATVILRPRPAPRTANRGATAASSGFGNAVSRMPTGVESPDVEAVDTPQDGSEATRSPDGFRGARRRRVVLKH